MRLSSLIEVRARARLCACYSASLRARARTSQIRSHAGRQGVCNRVAGSPGHDPAVRRWHAQAKNAPASRLDSSQRGATRAPAGPGQARSCTRLPGQPHHHEIAAAPRARHLQRYRQSLVSKSHTGPGTGRRPWPGGPVASPVG